MTSNAYTLAYACGYFYGRAYGEDAEIKEEDAVYRSNQGFLHGLEAGRMDFEAIDLVDQALEVNSPVDSEHF